MKQAPGYLREDTPTFRGALLIFVSILGLVPFALPAQPREPLRQSDLSMTVSFSPGASKESNTLVGRIEQGFLNRFPNSRLVGVKQSADLQITIDVLSRRVKRTPFYEESKQCAQYSEPDWRDSNIIRRALTIRCLNWEIKRINCESKVFELEVQIKGVDPKGAISLSGVETFSESIRACGNQESSDLQQAAALDARAAEWVLNYLARQGTRTSSRVVAQKEDAAPQVARLNWSNIKARSNPNALAIIIGIQNYKRVPAAEFANEDAKVFYNYAVRALGVSSENIKMLIDSQADEVEIFKTFQNWLQVKTTKDKSDIYVFYSGHGFPSEGSGNPYLLPHDVDRDLIKRTAIDQGELVEAIKAARPRNVTLFFDACYSGQTRSGETLIANARPISIKPLPTSYPKEFSVFSASGFDQLSSSSPTLKHGVFSYHLMRGLEGEADLNKDGQITNGEMRRYLEETVSRFALSLNRKQQPQFFGDPERVLVTR